MCLGCEDFSEVPETDWRRMVSRSLADHLEMIEDDAEEGDKREAANKAAYGVIVDTQCSQGIEIFALKEELKSLKGLVRRVSELLLDPTTDTTALASRIATRRTARTATTTGDHAPETSED